MVSFTPGLFRRHVGWRSQQLAVDRHGDLTDVPFGPHDSEVRDGFVELFVGDDVEQADRLGSGTPREPRSAEDRNLAVL